MNKYKNLKIVLVLSVFLIFLIIGSASAAEDADEIGNETILTSTTTDVDTVTNTVDEEVSAAETDSFGSDDANNQNNLLKSNVDEVVLKSSSMDVTTYDDLKNALDDNDISVINIKNDILFSNQIDIKRDNLAINGNGFNLDANNNQHFVIANKLYNVTFKNMNFINAYGTSTYGSALFLRGYNYDIVVENCTFTNCHGRMGGGIGFASRTSCYNCNITNCRFINCSASVSGGAINFHGGGHHDNIVKDCYFENITAGLNGGAIEFYTLNSVIDNCTFKNTTATASSTSMGGAIVLYNNAKYNNITNSRFINCYGRQGGAISLYQDSDQYNIVENCTFINNKAISNGGAIIFNARYSKLLNCNFTNNTAQTGGAIYYAAESCVVDNCLLINNTATSGGAVEFLGSNCNITNCNFAGNNATNEGGAVQFSGQNNYMGYCTYINNTANTDGGALCAKNSGTTVAYCNFINNTAPTGKDFFSHGYAINFEGLKFDTLWLSNKTLEDVEHTVGYGYGTSYLYPAAWEDDNVDKGFLENFLDFSSGKATI